MILLEVTRKRHIAYKSDVPAVFSESILCIRRQVLRDERIIACLSLSLVVGGASHAGDRLARTLPGPSEIIQAPDGLTAVWSPVPRFDACEDLTGDGAPDPQFQGVATAELFVRFDAPFRLFAVQSDPNVTEGLVVQMGEIRQHPLGSSVASPALDILCLPFDSYIVIGNQPIDSHLVIGSPSTMPGAFVEPWPNPLDVLWLAFDQPDPESIILGDAALQDADRFGDAGYYCRVARFTAAEGSEIRGQLEVQIQLENGDTTPFAIIDVPNCPSCWLGLVLGDVDGDGSTTTADLTFVVSNLGAGAPGATGTPGDADGDGETTTADITLVVSNLGSGAPTP